MGQPTGHQNQQNTGSVYRRSASVWSNCYLEHQKQWTLFQNQPQLSDNRLSYLSN